MNVGLVFGIAWGKRWEKIWGFWIDESGIGVGRG